MQSEQVGELAAALAKAQKAIKAPNKGRTAGYDTKGGQKVSYTYADLADVIAAYREPLSDNGLALVQSTRQEDGHLVLVTSLLHSSGQWVAGEYPVKVYDRPQEQGSAITYARRYSVTALLGIAAEDDDDGKRAQEAEPPKQEMSSEDAAILLLAAQLADLTPDTTAEEHIRAASAFTNKEGKFIEGTMTDPRRVKPGKWKSMTKTNLEKRLHQEQLKAEPGVEEGAAALT